VNSIANNLANVNTTGFKRDMLSFEDTFAMYAHDYIMEPVVNLRSKKLFPEPQHLARTRIASAQTDFEQGSLKVTGGPLDVAISGNGFFKVRTQQGDFYTRNGHFRLTSDGMLITEQGFPVLGNDAEITLPEGVQNFTIAENGDIYGDGVMMGSIDLVEVDNPLGLEKLGSNMYRPRIGAAIEEIESNSYMVQGFLEIANVNPVYEMVNMIEAQRQFEAYAKVMQTAEAIDKEAINRVGRAR
jgi:flagellar basal-body rod protein FlgG